MRNVYYISIHFYFTVDFVFRIFFLHSLVQVTDETHARSSSNLCDQPFSVLTDPAERSNKKKIQNCHPSYYVYTFVKFAVLCVA